MDLEVMAAQGDAIAGHTGPRFSVVVFDGKIPGDPFPAMRPRYDSKRGRTYTPKPYEDALEAVAWHLQAGRKCGPVATPVSVTVTFHRAHRNRCDVDNMLKTVLDAATKVLWLDDSQVMEVRARKVLGIGRAHACTVLKVVAADA